MAWRCGSRGTEAVLTWMLRAQGIGAFLQALQQIYIVFVQWGDDVSFDWLPTYLSCSLAMLTIVFIPQESPMFEDNR